MADPIVTMTFGDESRGESGNDTTDEDMEQFFEHLQGLGACNQRGAPCVERIRAVRGTGDRGARYLITQYENGNFTHAGYIFEYIAHTGSRVGNRWLREKAGQRLDWAPGDPWPSNDPELKRAILDRRQAILALGWINEESAIDDLLPLLDSAELSESGRLHAAKAIKHKLLYGDVGRRKGEPRSISPARREAALTKLDELASDPSGRNPRLQRSAARIASSYRAAEAR